MDKGNKVTGGATLTTAAAAVLVWAMGLAGIEIGVEAALGLVVLATAMGGAISDWLTDDG